MSDKKVHTEACRERMEAFMRGEPAYRDKLAAIEERRVKFLADYGEAQMRRDA